MEKDRGKRLTSLVHMNRCSQCGYDGHTPKDCKAWYRVIKNGYNPEMIRER